MSEKLLSINLIQDQEIIDQQNFNVNQYHRPLNNLQDVEGPLLAQLLGDDFILQADPSIENYDQPSAVYLKANTGEYYLVTVVDKPT